MLFPCGIERLLDLGSSRFGVGNVLRVGACGLETDAVKCVTLFASMYDELNVGLDGTRRSDRCRRPC